MNGSLGAYAPHGIALLAGGLLASLGPTFWARSASGRSRLLSLPRAAFGTGLAALTVLALAAAYLLVRSVISVDAGQGSVAVWQALALGTAVGLPMSVPGLVAARADARRRERESKKFRDRVPTKDDRRAFAADLVRQIREVSPKPRELRAEIAGDGGRVLRFEGEIDAEEGERLAEALRRDLREVGFKRLEGTHGSKEWWSRV